MNATLVDIHCHLLPGVDDGAKCWEDSIAMARMAVADGIRTIVATPHQLGSYAHLRGEEIRARVADLNQRLSFHQIDLTVLPGADVRIEPQMISLIDAGDVLTLADRRKHVLLELPHELYFSLESVLRNLQLAGMKGILSHPERNQGILREPSLIEQLVNDGCLMQITAGSLLGSMGPACRDLAEEMVVRRQAHIVASDAHGVRSRRPLLACAMRRVAELTDATYAQLVCCTNPKAVVDGQEVTVGEQLPRKSSWGRWFGSGKAA